MLAAGWITEDQLNKALKFQQQNPCLFGEALVKMNFSTEEKVAVGLSKQLGVPYASRENQILNPEKGQGLEKIMPEKFAREHAVVPLFIENNVLAVAMTDPANIMLIDNIKLVTGMDVQPFIATKAQILKVVDAFFAGAADLIDTVMNAAGKSKGETSESDVVCGRQAGPGQGHHRRGPSP